jgi:hypothetical protein
MSFEFVVKKTLQDLIFNILHLILKKMNGKKIIRMVMINYYLEVSGGNT